MRDIKIKTRVLGVKFSKNFIFLMEYYKQSSKKNIYIDLMPLEGIAICDS